MAKIQEPDMYEFIDDGVHKSIYTVLNEYHPQLKRDFSYANLINNLPELNQNASQVRITQSTYKNYFEKLAKMLLEKTSTTGIIEKDGQKVSDEDLNSMFEEFKGASKNNSDCRFFSTIKEYIEYATRNVLNPDTKPLRDTIVRKAAPYVARDEILTIRTILLKDVYLAIAENKVREVNHMTRNPGDYPEWDRLVAIRHILQKKGALEEYDEFYDEASAQIRAEAFKAMEKARISAICKMKRAKIVRAGLAPTLEAVKGHGVSRTSEMFDTLKRLPEKGENAWAYESFQEPELICDLEAEYSKEGTENQRVVAFRYGKFKYKNENDIGGLNVDRNAVMPELVGISRIGRDGTKTYFVLMPPLDKISFLPYGQKPQNPGDRPYGFLISQDVKVTTRSGGTVARRETAPARIVDAKTGRRLSAFRNRSIPENLKEFYAKVFFSDEYLENAIENNGRYIGNVIETDKGPQIVPSDTGKFDLAAAYYARYHEGAIDKVKVRNFEDYCSSRELEIRQYNLISNRERSKSQGKTGLRHTSDEAR